MYFVEGYFTAEVSLALYVEFLWHLYGSAQRIYEHSARLLGVETPLLKEVTKCEVFDHRTAADVYEVMANCFRSKFAFDLLPVFPGLVDGPDNRERVLLLWREFYREQIHELFYGCHETVRLLLAAAVYPEEDARGADARAELGEIMRERQSGFHRWIENPSLRWE